MSDVIEPGIVKIRLGVVAIASLLLTVASLTTLVIIVAIQGADLLSVVALALAVIAFSAQLIIYIVQAAQAAADNRRSLELHSQLSALLSELRERTGQTQQSVDTINERLLSAVIGKTRASAIAGEDTEEFAARVAETYAEVSREAPPSANTPPERPGGSHQWPGPLADSEAERIRGYMTKWPSVDEIPAIVDTLNTLDIGDRTDLARLADDLYAGTRPNTSIGPGLGPRPNLLRAGLAEKVRGWKLHTLSPEGMRLGRIYTAEGPVPDSNPAVLGLREEARRRNNPDVDRRDPDDR